MTLTTLVLCYSRWSQEKYWRVLEEEDDQREVGVEGGISRRHA